MSEISDLIDSLPKVNQDAISVGFNSITSIKPLKELLELLFTSQAQTINTGSDKQNEKTIKTFNAINKANQKIIEELQKKLADSDKKVQEALDRQNETYVQEAERESTRRKQFEAKLFTTLKFTSEAFLKQTTVADKIAKTFIDLEKGGIFLKDGVNSLGKAAANLGMTYEGLAGQLKKTSPLIARLNANMGDGLTAFKNIIQNIDDKYNLSREEQVTAFEAFMDKISPTQLRQMSQQELALAVNETAKQMKMLSIATGKTVEQLKQEQEIKNKEKRIQAYKRTHQESYNLMNALGFDDEMIDYIASGGTRTNSKILLQQMNDPAMQRMLPEVMRLANSNKLTVSTLKRLVDRNINVLNYKTEYANRMSFNKGLYSASAASPEVQYAVYDNSWGDRFADINFNALDEYLNRQEDNNMISNIYAADRAHNSFETNARRLESAGRNGINADALLRKKIYGAGSWVLGDIADTLEENGASNILTGTLFSGISNIMPHIKNYVGAGAELIFFDAVMTFRDTVRNQEGWWSKFKSKTSSFLDGKAGRVISGIGGLAMGGFGLAQIFGKSHKGNSKLSSVVEGGFYGAIAGGALGNAFLGPKGILGGAVVGASFGGISGFIKNFWDNTTSDSLSLSDVALLVGGTTAAGAIAGAALGGKIGGIKGALWGAVAGAAVGGITALSKKFFSDSNEEELKSESSYADDSVTYKEYIRPTRSQIKSYDYESNNSKYDIKQVTDARKRQEELSKEALMTMKENNGLMKELLDATKTNVDINKKSYWLNSTQSPLPQ